jgi:hypothetical protein
MGALGGSLLGLPGLEGWDAANKLSTGNTLLGLEGKPDGRVSASQMNLSVNDGGDNYLINDSGADVLLINTM